MSNSSIYLCGALRFVAFLLIFTLTSYAHAATCDTSWPEWDAFKKNLINENGRVVDGSAKDSHTTSEGQSYALFFSLVANDKTTFEKLVNWTEKNLSKEDIITHLPSWILGKKEDDSYGVLDTNSASDSDLWIAYTLGEAGRLWENRRYVALSSLLANRILKNETLDIPGLGTVLLPGAVGFTPTTTSVRLNPSYAPLQLIHWFNTHSNDPRWASLLSSSKELIVKSSIKGYAPDWTIYQYNKGFQPDTGNERAGLGSYDAIRVYLWAGMLNKDSPEYKKIMAALKPMAKLVEKMGVPPEFVHVDSGDVHGQGSSGFSAAMVPFLMAEGYDKAAEQQLMRIDAQPIAKDSYYDQVLILFALGWQKDLYRFDSKGNLAPRWKSKCQ
jgi:endoglucanase